MLLLSPKLPEKANFLETREPKTFGTGPHALSDFRFHAGFGFGCFQIFRFFLTMTMTMRASGLRMCLHALLIY